MGREGRTHRSAPTGSSQQQSAGTPAPPRSYRTGLRKVLQNSLRDQNRATICPHPGPLLQGEGTRTAASQAPLSLWERGGGEGVKQARTLSSCYDVGLICSFATVSPRRSDYLAMGFFVVRNDSPMTLRTKSGRPFFRISSRQFGWAVKSNCSRLLNYLHDVSKFVAVFLHIFHFDFFTNGRSAEGHEFGLEPHVHVD